jgi:hypothetical protein
VAGGVGHFLPIVDHRHPVEREQRDQRRIDAAGAPRLALEFFAAALGRPGELQRNQRDAA